MGDGDKRCIVGAVYHVQYHNRFRNKLTFDLLEAAVSRANRRHGGEGKSRAADGLTFDLPPVVSNGAGAARHVLQTAADQNAAAVPRFIGIGEIHLLFRQQRAQMFIDLFERGVFEGFKGTVLLAVPAFG